MQSANNEHPEQVHSQVKYSVDVGPRFDDLENIASGTFGEVYTAKDTLEDQLCVLKIEDA